MSAGFAATCTPSLPAIGLASAIRSRTSAAREPAELATLAAELGDDRLCTLTADVTREADCARVVEATLARFGRLDVLVNNAARGMKYVSDRFFTEPTPFWDVPTDVYRLVIDTNVTGPFLMARAAVPAMLRAGWGRIINVSVARRTMQLPAFTPGP